jgi:GntR family transcriptional regulator
MTLTMSGIERSSRLPLYHQLHQLLLEKIDGGTWKPGDLIPGEQELQDTYGLSRTTVRQALKELELDGRVTRYRGRGTFVSAPKIAHSPEPKRSLTETLLRRGMTPGWRVMERGDFDATEDHALRLGCKLGDTIHRLVRLRLANNEPIGEHTAFVSPAFRHAIDATKVGEGGSMAYLSADVLDGSRAERVLEAAASTVAEAEHLEIEAGAPVLRIRRLLVSADGEPIESLTAVYRGDRFEYRIDSVGSVQP